MSRSRAVSSLPRWPSPFSRPGAGRFRAGDHGVGNQRPNPGSARRHRHRNTAQRRLQNVLQPLRPRDIALALIIARVCRPGSTLTTTRWWTDTTLAVDLGVADATTDEVYAAMDWLAGRQDAIERKLTGTHLAGAGNPDRLALFDLSSCWVTGRCCPLAARGYSRDGKKGLPQIEPIRQM